MRKREALEFTHAVDWSSTVSGKGTRVSEEGVAFRTLLALHVAAQQVNAALGSWFHGTGISPSKFAVMLILDSAGEEITLSELRARLGSTQANVTGLISGLERDGLVSRRGSDEDHRVSYVTLSKTGKRRLKSLLPGFLKLNSALAGELGSADRKQLYALLTKVALGAENQGERG